MSDIIQHGFQHVEPRDPRLYRFGGISGLPKVIYQADRNWSDSLPELEVQNRYGYDRLACVSYSALNCVEIMAYRKYGDVINLSDRFTAKMDGTTREGNNFFDVAESISKRHGVVREQAWPDDAKSWEEYYTAVPSEIVRMGKLFLNDYVISYEYVWDDPEHIFDALQYGPIQVAVRAYGPEVNGIVQRIEGPPTHAITVIEAVNGKYWRIFDHYAYKFKNLAWDTKFWGAMRWDISPVKPKPPHMFEFKEDVMYFVAEGKGVEFAFVGGMLRYDDAGKLERQIMYRTEGRTEGHFQTILIKDLGDLHAFNLKGEDMGLASLIAA